IKGFMRSTSRRKLAILKSGITSKFNERGDKAFWRYTSIIKKIYDSIKENIIVFAPSKNFAEKLAKYIGAPILLEEPNRLMESLGISDLKDVPIIISVARSKLAEGIDLSYKGFTPRILLVIGLPFPKITQEDRIIIQFYSKIYNIKEPLLRKSLSLSSMFSALIQTIGRIGRKEKGFAIIVDDRILNFNLGIPVYNNLDQLVADVRSFLVS
ncbi:MAG: helicase C-terminal domain-containing protein, partial [Candidatus Njordarchaeales archaeon]